MLDHVKKLAFYRQMLRIRRVEERVESQYHLDEMKTPIHLCIGQEAVAVGVCAALEPEDYIQSNHRGHGHYLAKGGDLNAMIAELYCRESGCAKGRGGSMHLIDIASGNPGSSSIVGGGIPIGTGLALSAKLSAERKVSVILFGDGAANEGVLYESINFSILKKLPAIFVLEDNGWAVCSRREKRQVGDPVFLRLPHDQLYTAQVDGNDVEAVYTATAEAVDWARGGSGPAFIHAQTYRVRGHAGSYSDAGIGYRSQGEIDRWELDNCPLKRCRDKLMKEEILTTHLIEQYENELRSEIDTAFEFARRSSLPDGATLEDFLFREECHAPGN